MSPEDFHWYQIESILRTVAVDLLPVTDIRHMLGGSSPGRSLQKARDEIQQVSDEYKSEIDEAIERIVKKEKLKGTIIGPAKSWLLCRISTASSFLASLTTLGDARCISVFPPSRLTNEETIRYLLKEWWYEHGIDSVLQSDAFAKYYGM